MQPRLAKKIVRRVQDGDVNHTSYSRDQVRAAFRVVGVPLTEEHLRPWTDAAKVSVDPEVLAARTEANRARREATLASLEARRLDRAERRLAAQQKAMALAGAREAFKQAMQKGYVGDEGEDVVIANHVQTDTEEADPVVPEPVVPDYESMTVGDLKSIAKGRGLSGYSSLKKAELIRLLTEV